MQCVGVWIGCVYLVNGESDAPAAEEQRAPANGWCDLETLLGDGFREGETEVLCRGEHMAIRGIPGEVTGILRVEEIGKRLDDWVITLGSVIDWL